MDDIISQLNQIREDPASFEEHYVKLSKFLGRSKREKSASRAKQMSSDLKDRDPMHALKPHPGLNQAAEAISQRYIESKKQDNGSPNVDLDEVLSQFFKSYSGGIYLIDEGDIENFVSRSLLKEDDVELKNEGIIFNKDINFIGASSIAIDDYDFVNVIIVVAELEEKPEEGDNGQIGEDPEEKVTDSNVAEDKPEDAPLIEKADVEEEPENQAEVLPDEVKDEENNQEELEKVIEEEAPYLNTAEVLMGERPNDQSVETDILNHKNPNNMANRNDNKSKSPSDKELKSTIISPINICVLGDAETGKTQIIQTFCSENAKRDGANPLYNGKSARVKISENSSRLPENENSAHEKSAQAIVVVFDLSSRESFNSAKALVRRYQNKNGKIGEFVVPVVLCGNKADLEDRRVDRAEIDDYCKAEQVSYYEINQNDRERDCYVRPFGFLVNSVIQRRNSHINFVPIKNKTCCCCCQ